MKCNPSVCFYGHLYPGTLCSLLGLWERENENVESHRCVWGFTGGFVIVIVSSVWIRVLASHRSRLQLQCCCFCVLLWTLTPPPTTNLNPHDHVECQTLFHPSLLQRPPQRLWLSSMNTCLCHIVVQFGALRVTWLFHDFRALLFSRALVELSQSKRINEKPKPELANHLNAFTVRNVCCWEQRGFSLKADRWLSVWEITQNMSQIRHFLHPVQCIIFSSVAQEDKIKFLNAHLFFLSFFLSFFGSDCHVISSWQTLRECLCLTSWES